MGDYLIFQLYGPLSAWGEIAVGEIRRSAAYPSKSAVMGLVGAALGIRRDAEPAHQELCRSYGFGVKVLSMGTLLQDYHTTQVPPTLKNQVFHTRKDELAAPKLGTILSTREYRCDASCVVALWVRADPPPHPLMEMADALNQPRLILYLGRKSCPPSLPLQARVVSTATLKDALDDGSVGFDGDGRLPRHAPTYCWDETENAGMSPSHRIIRHDDAVSRKRWQFEPRSENVLIQREVADAL